jgi:hypothetical protein
MKQGIFVSISLVLVFLFCAPLFSQPSTRSIETVGIDNFDTADQMTWTWKTQASGFVTEGYPQIDYFDGVPNSLRPLRTADDPVAKVLGVKVKYDRKGSNWFELFPVPADGSPGSNGRPNYEIPFIGTVKQIDFWVWGANYLYYLDLLVRDAEGRVHVIPAGHLAFSGWRNLVINVPTYILQASRLRSGPETMSFVGFRVRTDPAEFVDDFVVYFDQLRYTTSILANIYDGYELRKLDFESSGGAR